MGVSVAAHGFTTWHITWGTYGTRLHGGDRPTVQRSGNAIGEPFVESDTEREKRSRQRMCGEAVWLTIEERCIIEAHIPRLCTRGEWVLRECAAGPDHVHVLCDATVDNHGKRVRRWLKTWLTKTLNERFGVPEAGRWWAEGGSTRAVKDPAYLHNVTDYVHRQRATEQ